eukprot:5563921-Pleurochrysis_carterae.AAC.1
MSPFPQPQQEGQASSSSQQQQIIRLQPVGASKSHRALERALNREVRAHAQTLLRLESASSAAAAQAIQIKALAEENSCIAQLERLVLRLTSSLDKAPTVESHEVLKADLRRAEQRARALAWQQEDGAARGLRIAASLRRERDAAFQSVLDEEKQRAAMERKADDAAVLARESVRRAQMLRSGKAALVAEDRAVTAERQVADLRDAAKQLAADADTARAEANEQHAACLLATRQACHASALASDLQREVVSGADDIRALQRDLCESVAKMGDMKRAFAVEKKNAVFATQAACEAGTAAAVLAAKDAMVAAAIADPNDLCAHANDIVSAKMRAFPAGELFKPQAISKDKNGNITHRGRARTFVALVDGTKNADTVGNKQLRNRSSTLTSAINVLASGEAHATVLLADHAKANPRLYKHMGLKLQKKLDVEQTAALCNETSGLLGAAMRRHLKSCGVKVASKADVQGYFRDSWEECETGKITVPDPRRSGRVVTGAWLR